MIQSEKVHGIIGVREIYCNVLNSPSSVPTPAPLVGQVARPARSLTPSTRVGIALEVLRSSPYSVLPIVDESGIFVGWLTESVLVHALFEAANQGTGHRLQHEPLQPYIIAPPCLLLPDATVASALVTLDTYQLTAIPVVSASRHYYGLISYSDMVQDLARPLNVPTIGGMATPVGVYLTNGIQAGGVGYFGLFLSGLLLFTLQFITLLIVLGSAHGLESLQSTTLAHFPQVSAPIARIPSSLRLILGNLWLALVIFCLTTVHALFLMTLVRFSPVAGYHAAEHQVVHAMERGEPLLVETVRTMPRVHPRCGTNLVAGFFLFNLGEAFQPLLGSLSYPIFAVLALLYWRRLGSWVQYNLTTRPANTKEIESGIQAAQMLLKQMNAVSSRSLAPNPSHPLLTLIRRIGRMGFLQIASGFCLGIAILWLLMYFFPALDHLLLPYWNEIIG